MLVKSFANWRPFFNKKIRKREMKPDYPQTIYIKYKQFFERILCILKKGKHNY